MANTIRCNTIVEKKFEGENALSYYGGHKGNILEENKPFRFSVDLVHLGGGYKLLPKISVSNIFDMTLFFHATDLAETIQVVPRFNNRIFNDLTNSDEIHNRAKVMLEKLIQIVRDNLAGGASQNWG